MINYPKTQSTVKPEPIVMDKYSVWVHTDITPVSVTVDGVASGQWEYSIVQYGKDEYIRMIQENDVES